MKLYRITYRAMYCGIADPSAPEFTWHTRAHNEEHARMRFDDLCEAEGDLDWQIVRCERIKE